MFLNYDINHVDGFRTMLYLRNCCLLIWFSLLRTFKKDTVSHLVRPVLGLSENKKPNWTAQMELVYNLGTTTTKNGAKWIKWNSHPKDMSYERVLLAAEPFDVPTSDLSKVSKINKGKVLYAGIIISVLSRLLHYGKWIDDFSYVYLHQNCG